jgi:hypothetical protein
MLTGFSRGRHDNRQIECFSQRGMPKDVVLVIGWLHVASDTEQADLMVKDDKDLESM